jgi:hypothetical protein
MDTQLRLDRLIADFGQIHVGLVFADHAYNEEVSFERFYDFIEREEDTGAERLHSGLARAIVTRNPAVTNRKYLGRIVRIQIIKAVRRA